MDLLSLGLNLMDLLSLGLNLIDLLSLGLNLMDFLSLGLVEAAGTTSYVMRSFSQHD